MQIYQWSNLDEIQKEMLLQRPLALTSQDLKSKVADLLKEVELGSLQSLLEITERLDKVRLTELQVPRSIAAEALSNLDASLRSAMEQAQENIEKFHRKQLPESFSMETSEGVICERQFRPIQRVGLYIPAGSAPLFSTVLMLAIPAKLAGCQEIVLCSPPQSNGRPHETVLAAAELCGIGEIYSLGGVQAIGALAYGRGGVPKVDKIFGPGNSWVTEAKSQVAQGVPGLSIDMPAGPSEVLVIADEKANAEFVAWDLLSQAEHGPDSQAVLLSTSGSLCEKVLEKVTELIENSVRREQLLQSFRHMRSFKVNSIEEALSISNEYAPEHLILNTVSPRQYLDQIVNAGSVFLGALTPESAGDYASGTNHVLPTSGYARSMGGLTLSSFLKSMTVQEVSAQGVKSLAPVVEAMAEAEGLEAHQQAMRVRRLAGESQ